MVDIYVKDLVKAFKVGENLLDGLSFEIQQGERVGLLGKNGAGKTTVFRILCDEIGYDTGDVVIAPGKKIGLISQIPRYPADYTVEQVLRRAFTELEDIRRKMERLEARMTEEPSEAVLRAVLLTYSARAGMRASSPRSVRRKTMPWPAGAGETVILE